MFDSSALFKRQQVDRKVEMWKFAQDSCLLLFLLKGHGLLFLLSLSDLCSFFCTCVEKKPKQSFYNGTAVCRGMGTFSSSEGFVWKCSVEGTKG